jgi:hypothetical protein
MVEVLAGVLDEDVHLLDSRADMSGSGHGHGGLSQMDWVWGNCE